MEHRDPLLALAYSACSVFALPSTLETPGLAALEAAAAGAPLWHHVGRLYPRIFR